MKGKGEADSCSSSRGAMDHACFPPPKDVQRSPIPICTIMKNSWEKSRVLPKALDLFTGTGSVANRLRELGYHVTTLDIRPWCDPNICVDILTWRYWEVFSPGDFEVIGASVPCTEYSLAKTKGVRNFRWADRLVEKNI